MNGLMYLSMLKLESVPTKVDWSIHFENIDIGLMTTVLGIVIVFLILIVISLLLAIFSVLVKDREKQQPRKKAAPPQSNIPAFTPSAGRAQPQNLVDDKELVAVITAAIAASAGTNTDGLIVRRIRRVGNWTDTI